MTTRALFLLRSVDPVDVVAPVLIAGPTASLVTSNGADVGWSTNEVADAQTQYGPTAAYGSATTRDAAFAINHLQVIAGLAPSTTYHFRVLSRDPYGNLLTSGDGTFTTAAAGAQVAGTFGFGTFGSGTFGG